MLMSVAMVTSWKSTSMKTIAHKATIIMKIKKIPLANMTGRLHHSLVYSVHTSNSVSACHIHSMFSPGTQANPVLHIVHAEIFFGRSSWWIIICIMEARWTRLHSCQQRRCTRAEHWEQHFTKSRLARQMKHSCRSLSCERDSLSDSSSESKRWSILS